MEWLEDNGTGAGIGIGIGIGIGSYIPHGDGREECEEEFVFIPSS